ncbi:MAG: hypothetical protein ACLSG5_12450 [Oscillospiraceae bacterium]
MFKKTTAAIILSAVIMAGSSVSAFAETPVQTVVVEQECGFAAKTWDGKAALKAGQKYVIKKNVTVSGKVTLPKGTTLTVKKGAKLTIGSKGALTVKGTLSVKSGATLAVSGTLTTAKGSKLTDAGTIKFAKTAKVTLGGKLTVSKTGKVTGAPKSIKLAKTGSAAITGTNSCKKLAALLSTAADSTKDTLAQDKKEVETFLNNVADSVIKDGSVYSAIKMAVPADYFKQTEDEFNAYTKTLDPSDEAYGMTFEQFIDALLSAQIESITNSVQSIKISVADLSDCKSKLTADQKQMYANCGDIAKAYIAKIKSDVTFKPGADTSGYNTDDLGEITVVNAGGNWYIAG